ncbi:MAG TPA: hypothetical protein VKZ51_02635 [Cyclobacteriaceae bacterium]|nr:hypothetical protein [Cyclobacteriaceae bacterium]
MIKKGCVAILALLFSAGCGIINITKSGEATGAFDDYHEDLSTSRIVFPEIPEIETRIDYGSSSDLASGNAVDKDLEEALAHFARTKSEEPYFSGFTILVYSGVDRDLAFKTRNDLYSHFPDIKAEMQYQQPRYLVKVGRYINRIEALPLYEKVNSQFPAARIIQDRFQKESAEPEAEQIQENVN